MLAFVRKSLGLPDFEARVPAKFAWRYASPRRNPCDPSNASVRAIARRCEYWVRPRIQHPMLNVGSGPELHIRMLNVGSDPESNVPSN